MTTIITRLYASEDAAQKVADDLLAEGISGDSVQLIGGGKEAMDKMLAARVPEGSAEAYKAAMSRGRTLLVAEVGFNPFGAAAQAIKTVGQHEAIDAGVENENAYLREEPGPELQGGVLYGAPLFLTRRPDPNAPPRKSLSELFDAPTTSKHRTTRSAIAGGAHMSTKLLPFPLLRERRPARPMRSRLMVSKPVKSNPRKNSVIGGTSFVMSELLNWPLLLRR